MRKGEIEQLFNNMRHKLSAPVGRRVVSRSLSGSIIFIPGVFLCLLALTVVFMPSLVLALLASVLFFFGVLFCVIAWKVRSWKQRMEQVAREMRASGIFPAAVQGTVMFSQGSSNEPFTDHRRNQKITEIHELSEKGEKIKIIVH